MSLLLGYSLLRRASPSLVPLAIRAVGSPRTVRGPGPGPGPPPISADSIIEDAQLCRRLVLHPRARTSSVYFSTSTTAKEQSSDDYLIPIIDSEISCAQELDDHYHVGETPDRFLFKIQDNPGKRIVVLKRVYQNETIEVEVNLPNFGLENGCEGDADVDVVDQNSKQPSIPLIVTVFKGRQLCLQFGVTAFPDQISIDSLSIKEQENSEDQLAYGGPEFSDMDEKLQRAFHKYLDARGIKPSTTGFLYEYMVSKDSKEYLQWLKNIKEFAER